MTRFPGMVAFAVIATASTAAMPVLSGEARHLLFLVISVVDLIAVTALLPRVPRGDRMPFVQLALGTAWMLVNSVLSAFGGDGLLLAADLVLGLSNLHLFAAAVWLVLRRGRNDIGGLIDAGVMAIVVAALIWTVGLQPRLDGAGTSQLMQINLLASVLLLSGVLGTLVRVIRTSRPRSLPLLLFAAAVLCDLAGYVAAITGTGSVSTQSSMIGEIFFMLGFVMLGLAVMHPGAPLLARPGPVPPDRLFAGRVVLLTAAATVVPLVSGVREILGIRGDAALLTVGNLLIVGLVAFRVARLGSEREAAEARLRHQATHDLLTGLPNRAELWTRLDAALSREQRAGVPSVVLLFCDLNGFKQVNDRLGHLAGDRLLTEVAARLCVTGAFAARYGGDEFVLLCEDPDQLVAADRLTAHIRAVLAPPVLLSGENVRVGASVGAVLSDGRLDADQLIRRADQAMYADKATHRAA